MPEFSLVYASARHIHLENFDDEGLSTGPRRIRIYLPDGYDRTDERYPVIYFSDGDNVFARPGATMAVDTAYDSLIADGLINPAIFVGIGLSSVPDRLKSMTPTTHRGGGGLDGYYRFISELLKSYIDSHYRTKSEPASTGIAGYSLGGSSSFIMAYQHPETFGMAGCMSPSLWSDDKYALKLLTEGDGAKRPVRFWLDAGGGEYEMWINAAHACSLMEHQGWIFGDDLAAYFDYPADHNFEAGAGRMREMLHFLLRKDPYVLESYRLVPAVDPAASAMDLGSGLRRIVGAEAWYTNGFRLTPPKPEIIASDTCVVATDMNDPLLLHGVAPGETTISSTYQGHTASLPVIGCDPDMSARYLPCPLSNDTLNVGENLAEKFDLPYDIVDGNGAILARFGICHDPQHIHIAVHVLDNMIVVDPDKLPWEQDAVEFNFDARPESDLRVGNSSYDNSLAFYMTPGLPGKQVCMHYSELDGWLRALLPGVEGHCAVVADGYVAMLSMPVGYLHERQGDPWRVFRLNVRINTVDAIGGPAVETCWQAPWEKFHSRIDTGIFRRR